LEKAISSHNELDNIWLIPSKKVEAFGESLKEKADELVRLIEKNVLNIT